MTTRQITTGLALTAAVVLATITSFDLQLLASTSEVTEGVLWIATAKEIFCLRTPDEAGSRSLSGADEIRAVGTSSRTEMLWMAAADRLIAYGADGRQIWEVPIEAETRPIELVPIAADQSVWLAAGEHLRSFSSSGQMLSSFHLRNPVQRMALDEDRSLLWIATESSLAARDVFSGLEVASIDLPGKAVVRGLALDSESGNVLLGLDDRLQRYDSGGWLLAEEPVANLVAVGRDGRGGLWIATTDGLFRRGVAGAPTPFEIPWKVVDLVADPAHAAVWVTDGRRVARIDASGRIRRLAFGSGARIERLSISPGLPDAALWRAVTARSVSLPWLEIVAPAEAILLNRPQPEVIVEYIAAGTPIDLSSLKIVLDDSDLTGGCSIGPEAAVCTPPVLDEGRHTLTAHAQDEGGQTATSTHVFHLLLGDGEHEVTLPAIADTYLPTGPKNRNFGNVEVLRLHAGAQDRVLARFDLSEVEPVIDHLLSTHLELFIERNAGNWSAEGRPVEAHRLLAEWTESGATWNCPDDKNPDNRRPDCDSPWYGGTFDLEATDSVIYTDGLLGRIRYDVTADVEGFLAGDANYGWLLKKRQQAQNGRADYTSREGASGEGPRLVLKFEGGEPLDEEPPTLSITAPQPGTFLADSAPEIVCGYSDAGSGVDPESLVFELAGQPLAATCLSDDFGAVCTLEEPLVEGPVSLTATVRDFAGNVSEPAEVSFTVDLTAPQIELFSPADGKLTDQPAVTFVGQLSESAELTLDGEPVSLDPDHGFAHGPVALSEGANVFLLAATDAAGNSSELAVTVHLDTGPTRLLTSPAHGEQDVAVTRETILRFSRPLAPSTVVDAGNAFAAFGGDDLSARYHVSSDRRTVTLFYDKPLPASARVRLTVIGDQLTDAFGLAVDADGDGVPGGTAVVDFDTLTLTVVPGTIVCGRVFASELVFIDGVNQWVNEPLAGVTITVDGMEETLFAVTDELGDFRLDPAPAGRFFIHIDGRTATNDVPPGAYYPVVGKAWESVPGQEVNVGEVFLPLVGAGTLQEVSETEDTEVGFPDEVLEEHPELEGVTLTVPAGSLYADDGTPGGQVGIAPVDPERLPGTLPGGLDFALVITVQTDGATNFDRPAPICFPNLPDPITGEVLPPGAPSALWSFNHDAGRWEVVGSMTVTADGTRVCTDPGVGILAPGWHGTRPGSSGGGGGAGGPSPPPPPCGGANPASGPGPPDDPPFSPDDNDTNPVLLYSGEKFEQVIDLRIRGVGLDFVWARTYGSRNGPDTAQGNGWDFSYNMRLIESGTGIRVLDGAWRDELYLPVVGQSDMWARNGYFNELRTETDGFHSLITADRRLFTYRPFDGTPAAGKIHSLSDRNGNTLEFQYDADGRLVTVIDTLGRPITISYNADGFISSMTDFIGRSVRYEYYGENESGGSFGDLKAVTSPTVVGMPNGNDFPAGKTTTYTYSKGFADERLNHNLLTITDGRRNDPNDSTFQQGPYLVNVYSSATDPREPTFDRVVRQIRGGDAIDITYVPQRPTAANNQAVVKVILNDREGNVTETFYDAGSRRVRLLEYTGRADPVQPTTETMNRPTGKLRPGDPEFFLTRWEYNADWLTTRMIHPNGNVTEFVYQTDLDPVASARTRGNLRSIRRLPAGHEPGGDQEVITESFDYDSDFGCGACGFNFVTRHVDGRGHETLSDYDDRGNLIRRTHRIPSIVEEFDYNDRGQMTRHVHPDNGSGSRRVDVMTYHESGAQKGYLSQEIIDQPGFALTTSFEYDPVGNVIREIDPRGHDTQFVVNQLNQVVREISREVTDGSGVRYQKDSFYDANDNLNRIDVQNVDDLGVVQANSHFMTTFEYEILNHLIRKTEEVNAGHSVVTEYQYDRNRNRTLTRYGEATAGRQPDNVVQMLYDERDLLWREIRAPGSPLQSSTQLDYDRNRNLIRRSVGLEEDPRVYEMTYDGYNRKVAAVDPMGNVVSTFYDANHNVARKLADGEIQDVEGESGNVRLSEVAYTYDPMDRLVREQHSFFDTESQAAIDDGLATTETEYSDTSQIVRVVDDNGHETLTAYDTANRRASVTDAKGNRVVYTYDANSNIVSLFEEEKSDLGNPDQTFTTMFAFDNLDRQVRRVDNVGNRIDYAYDSRDNLVSTSDALRPEPSLLGNVTRFEFDGLNRLIRTTYFLTNDGTGAGSPAGTITTAQAWDDSSRLVAQIDDNGNATAYEYDALDRKFSTTYADGTVHASVYDVHGNEIERTDANGSVAIYSYDLLDRRIGTAVSPGPGVSSDTTFETYRYDGQSRQVYAEDDDSVVERSYDSLSNVVRERLNGQSTLSTHDGVGNQLSCTYPGGRVITTTYDELDRKKTISDANGIIASYLYVGPDRVERREYGNDTRTDYTYDGITGLPNPADDFGVKKIIRTTHSRIEDDTVFDDRAYRWDRMFNKTRHTELHGGGTDHVYAYDSIYRLVQSARTPASGPAETITYSLDGVGNRTAVSGGEDTGSYVLDPTLPKPADFQMNQYTETPFDSRMYDANGNLVAIDEGLPSERKLVWDYHNRLIEFTDSASGIGASYAYDALGRRIERIVNESTSRTIRYFYDGWQVGEEQDAAGATLATYAYGGYIDEVLQMQRGSDGYHYHDDDSFNAWKVSNSLGTVVESYDYGEFGEPAIIGQSGDQIPSSVLDNTILFNGRRFDLETHSYYYRARYLSSKTGRFLAIDPIGMWTDMWNLGNGYTYAANSPWVVVDPFGLQPPSHPPIPSPWNFKRPTLPPLPSPIGPIKPPLFPPPPFHNTSCETDFKTKFIIKQKCEFGIEKGKFVFRCFRR